MGVGEEALSLHPHRAQSGSGAMEDGRLPSQGCTSGLGPWTLPRLKGFGAFDPAAKSRTRVSLLGISISG